MPLCSVADVRVRTLGSPRRCVSASYAFRTHFQALAHGPELLALPEHNRPAPAALPVETTAPAARTKHRAEHASRPPRKRFYPARRHRGLRERHLLLNLPGRRPRASAAKRGRGSHVDAGRGVLPPAGEDSDAVLLHVCRDVLTRRAADARTVRSPARPGPARSRDARRPGGRPRRIESAIERITASAYGAAARGSAASPPGRNSRTARTAR